MFDFRKVSLRGHEGALILNAYGWNDVSMMEGRYHALAPWQGKITHKRSLFLNRQYYCNE